MASLAHWDPLKALRRRDETLEDFFRDALPAQVEIEAAKADLKNGMLTITLPKSKASKPKQIKVAA